MTISTITLTAEQVRRLIVDHAPSSTAFATMMKMIITHTAKVTYARPWVRQGVATLEEWMLTNVAKVLKAEVTTGSGVQLTFANDVDAVEFALMFADLLGSVHR